LSLTTWNGDQHIEALEIFILIIQATLKTRGIGTHDTWGAANYLLTALEVLDGVLRVQLTLLELFETLLVLGIKQGLPPPPKLSACLAAIPNLFWRVLRPTMGSEENSRAEAQAIPTDSYGELTLPS
jgi:hypothetical protein